MNETQRPIRIVVADDHPLVRIGLRQVFDRNAEFIVVGEAADGFEALRQVKALNPDILLLDVAMPNKNGLEVLGELEDGATGVRTILLTAAIEGEEVVRALELGARGVVLKESATEQVFECIRTVMNGEYWVGREHVGDLLHTLRQLQRASQLDPPPSATLTPRERQVIDALIEGATNKDIALSFGVGEQTIKNHLSSIFDKLGVSNRLELVLYVVHHRQLGGVRASDAPTSNRTDVKSR